MACNRLTWALLASTATTWQLLHLNKSENPYSLWHYVLLVDDHKKCQRQTVRVSKRDKSTGYKSMARDPLNWRTATATRKIPNDWFPTRKLSSAQPAQTYTGFTTHVSRSHSKIWLWKTGTLRGCPTWCQDQSLCKTIPNDFGKGIHN